MTDSYLASVNSGKRRYFTYKLAIAAREYVHFPEAPLHHRGAE
jgi:hypothetical protein